ncbi:transmembrane anchor protein [Chitinimonas sp. BJYL2]|uniref:transmembrane anchor protein n=1 Tax=Chitinimonas sp. BJYL2 TaxID=2976696 RepID=UPI0022B56B2E|nr:transmembrane anchor protein [Chitinimonas sp. BJYL2]
MYNTDMPSRAELPSSRQLIQSTLAAIVIAAVLLITVVLPAEYAIDPTGIGQSLGLTRMGEIKTQLAAEATGASTAEAVAPAVPAPAPAGPVTAEVATPDAGTRQDQMTVTLKPNEATEIKLAMNKGDRIDFRWQVQGGVVNYDTHGDQGQTIKYHGYGKGKGSAGEAGMLEAAFDGHHGWFWRNRGSAPVTVTLETRGHYQDIKKVL